MKTSKKLISVTAMAIMLTVVLAGCGKEEEKEEIKPKKQVAVQTIQYQDEVTSILTASGTIVPKQYSVIRSLTQGTIEYVAPVGSKVTIGQPLFQIRNANIENSYFNTLQNFRQTNILVDERITQTELTVNSAEARLTLAQKNLETVKKQTEQALVNIESSTIITYNSAYNTLSQFFKFISVGNIDRLDFRYHNLATAQTQLLNDMRNQYLIATENFLKLASQADESNLNNSLNELYGVLIETKTLADAMVILLQDALGGVDNVESDKLIISNYQTQINSYTDAIVASQNALKNTVTNNQLTIDQSENTLTLAQIEFDNTQLGLTNAQNRGELEKIIAQSQLDNAAYGYNNLFLASPFSGTVLSITAEAGQQVSIGQEILELGNLSIVEIEIEVDAEFAKGLKLGNEVKINELYDGTISEIEPVGDIQSGKVGITVQTSNQEGFLVAGDIAEVELTLTYKEPDSIIIPINTAVIESVGTNVLIVQDGIAKKIEITLGRVFGSKVSVASGLEEGDQLILRNGVFVSEGDEVEVEK